MFEIFKKSQQLPEVDFNFLKVIVSSLPLKYSDLIKQVTHDFLLGKKLNSLGDHGCYTLLLDAELAKQYSNTELPRFFIIQNIRVFNNRAKDYDCIELHILEGMLAGFKVTSKYKYLDLIDIDVSGIQEKHFLDEDKQQLDNILGAMDPKLKDKLDLGETFKIELPEGRFYVIKNLGDGNYLSVTENGEIYKMLHDPYQVKQIFPSLNEFYEALRTDNSLI